MSSLEEKLMNIEIPPDKFEKWQKDCYKSAKGSGVVVWDRDYYIKEAEKQLGDKHCVKSVQIQSLEEV